MAHLITFRTAKFDPRAEPENPINPIAGHALLVWLRAALRDRGVECGEPDAEDWGWYFDASSHGATYLVGASGDPEPTSDGVIDWTIQLHRHRSLSDKLSGRNAHAADDALTSLVERLIRDEPAFSGVDVDRAG